MKYCGQCGAPAEQKIPEGDNRSRAVCSNSACGYIHYDNPRIIVGCLVTSGDKVLLCKRAIEPQYGLWTLPAGFMENGETCAQGALRETLEEAAAETHEPELYRVFDLPYINQVYMFYRAELLLKEGVDSFSAGPESLEVELFDEADIPWSALAFPVMTDTLVEFFSDRKSGEFPVRISKPSKLWQEHRKSSQDS